MTIGDVVVILGVFAGFALVFLISCAVLDREYRRLFEDDRDEKRPDQHGD